MLESPQQASPTEIKNRRRAARGADQGSKLRILRVVGQSHPCSYLPDRTAAHEYVLAERFSAATYHTLMNANFRRAGQTAYRPVCRGCDECKQLRVAAEAFRPDRSQRRNARANRDLEIRVGPPSLSDERLELYRRYQADRHGEPNSEREDLERFLYTSCVPALEWQYRLDGALRMVSIVDAGASFLSAVYCYYDPSLPQRGLGTFNMLTLLKFAREQRIPWVYLGYYVSACGKMNYKARFRPCEVLVGGAWEPLGSDPARADGCMDFPARGGASEIR